MQKVVIPLIAALCLVVFGVVVFLAMKAPTRGMPTPQPLASTSTAPTTPGYTIEVIPNEETPEPLKAPNLERAVTFSGSVPESTQAALRARHAELVARLTADPTNGGAWFNLALVYHEANDYDGAREIWEFLAGALPEDTTALDNLGKLYLYNLKDYPKSESYFMGSIMRNPELTTPYLELFNLYRYSYKTDTAAAVDMMSLMKARFPGNTDPHMLLAGYYRDTKDYAHARVEYEAALDIARTAGNVALVGAIGNELSSLPQ